MNTEIRHPPEQLVPFIPGIDVGADQVKLPGLEQYERLLRRRTFHDVDVPGEDRKWTCSFVVVDDEDAILSSGRRDQASLC